MGILTVTRHLNTFMAAKDTFAKGDLRNLERSRKVDI